MPRTQLLKLIVSNFSTSLAMSCHRLRMKNYEELAMLSHNMRLVHIDEDKVVQEYLRHLQKKDWNKEKTIGNQQVMELERELAGECGGGLAKEDNKEEMDGSPDVSGAVDVEHESNSGSVNGNSDTE